MSPYSSLHDELYHDDVKLNIERTRLRRKLKEIDERRKKIEEAIIQIESQDGDKLVDPVNYKIKIDDLIEPEKPKRDGGNLFFSFLLGFVIAFLLN